MRALIEAFDWSQTPLGPMERWSSSLRTLVGVVLASGFPMYIAWGREYIQIYNDAFRPILGSTKHPGALGISTAETFAEIWDQVRSMFELVITEGEPVVGQDLPFMLDRHGYLEECFFTFSYSPIPADDGGVAGILVTAMETTGRVLTERRIESSERQLRLITDALPALVAYIDREYRYQFNNLAYHDWFGIDPASMRGRTAAEVFGPEVFSKGKPELDRALGGQRVDLELSFTGPDGRHRDVAFTLVPDVDASGHVRGIISITSDITARRVAERQLQQAQRIQAVGKLAGGLAHEVNNQMTAVLGFGEFAMRQVGHQPVRADIEEMIKAGTRAANITQQLLAFSRQQVLQPKILSINSVIDDVKPMINRLLGADRALRLELAEDLGEVRVDKSQLEQVLVNLALNARDAMPSGGTLSIRTERVFFEEAAPLEHGVSRAPGWHAAIRVEDDGHGMDADTLARAFEPFFTTKPVGQGTGLGLSTVYGIIVQSGGSVDLVSELGGGTVVSAYLPIAVPDARDAAVPRQPAKAGKGEMILIVEDEDVVREISARLLEGEGYRIAVAANGEEALDQVAALKGEVHLVVCDLVMPGISGRELGDRLGGIIPKTPILYISGYPGEEVLRRALLPSGARLLQKPFTPVMLAEQVRQILDSTVPRS
jgi:PAS domain S-box-containing protein